VLSLGDVGSWHASFPGSKHSAQYQKDVKLPEFSRTCINQYFRKPFLKDAALVASSRILPLPGVTLRWHYLADATVPVLVVVSLLGRSRLF
jgi:hypothetical protein